MRPILTKEAFADWCEKQPAEKTYDYCDPVNCAMTQFVRSIGFDIKTVDVEVGTPFASFTPEGARTVRLPHDFEPTSWEHPRTFGALAARLRAA